MCFAVHDKPCRTRMDYDHLQQEISHSHLVWYSPRIGLRASFGVQCTKMCSVSSVIKNGTCYNFHWHNPNQFIPLKNVCPQPDINPMCLKSGHTWEYLLQSLEYKWPFLLLMHEKNDTLVHVIIYGQITKTCSSRVQSSTKVHGFYVCMTQQTQVVQAGNIFACQNGGYISVVFVCDNTADCPNDISDEQHYVCGEESNDSQLFCKHVKSSTNTVCGHSFMKTVNNTCEMFIHTDQQFDSMYMNINQISCTSGVQIDERHWNDLVPDCDPEGEDEPSLRSLVIMGTFVACSDPGQIPCRAGHPRCFNISDICHYQIDKFSKLQPCPNGAHLQACRGFECNMKFKCSYSYCVHWLFLCNNRWDCPHGEDENFQSVCGNGTICESMYKCKDSQRRCIHTGSVCDGIYDCPLQEDEYLCELQTFLCIKHCKCLALAISCRNGTSVSILKALPFISIEITSTQLEGIHIIKAFPVGIFFTFNKNGMNMICNTFPENTSWLDVQFNKVLKVHRQCFESLSRVRNIKLDWNSISEVESGAFANLTNLVHISISNNPLTKISDNFLSNVSRLEMVHMESNETSQLTRNVFQPIQILVFVTDYHICCFLPAGVTCSKRVPWYIPCSDMFHGKREISVLSIVLAIVIIIVKIACSVLNKLSNDTKPAFKKCVFFVSVSEMFCACYLAIIWISNKSMPTYVATLWWRGSSGCFASFFALIWFSGATQFALMLLSLARLMVVVQPMKTKFKSGRYSM